MIQLMREGSPLGRHDVLGATHQARANLTRGAAFLARRLAPSDRIALVAYDDNVRLVTPLANPSAALANAIASIALGNMTNLSGGWMKGLEVLGGADERGAIRKSCY